MQPSPQLKVLVDQMPDPDGRGMYTTDIDKEKIEKAIAEIHSGGRESILGLIAMLVPPGEGDDVKAHYALHCLANHVLVIEDENARGVFSETLAWQLGGDLPKPVKAYLCQELQWSGHKEAAKALGEHLLDEELVEPATMALVAIRDGAAEQFRAALPRATGKCRLNVIQGLGAVGDKQSVGALQAALADTEREIRLAAGWGLARMGDPGSVDLLIKASDAQPGWERIQATKHCLVLAEKLVAANRRDLAERIAAHLRSTRTEASEKYVREAAERALSG